MNETDLLNRTVLNGLTGFPSLLPFVLFDLDSDFYIIVTSLIVATAIIPNIFIIVEILRIRRRRSMVNLLIVFGRFVALVSLFNPILIFAENHLLCFWIYILFPGLVLFEKLLQSFQAVVRYLYIYCEKFMNLCYYQIVLSLVIFFTLGFTCLPYLTIVDFYPILYVTCEPYETDDKPSNYQFLFFYFIVCINSAIVDTVCYVRILNYMRKNSVRVTVVATTNDERRKGKNIITAPSSLLIWLITLVSMIPVSIIQLKSPALSSTDASNDTITLLQFELSLQFYLTAFLPVLYIGSSAELREDIIRFVRYAHTFFMPPRNDNNVMMRRDVYAISEDNNRTSAQHPSSASDNGLVR